MIKLFSLKQQKAKEAAEGNKKKKTSASILRMQKDMSDMTLPPTCSMDFPDPDDLLNFSVTIKPDEGYYKNGTFKFVFKIGEDYPHQPPKVKCVTKIYHPNIDLEGNVCLNVLREDWKPVLNINTTVYGLQYIFLEPNASDPLNKDAAKVLHRDQDLFASNVKKSMRGGTLDGVKFEKCI